VTREFTEEEVDRVMLDLARQTEEEAERGQQPTITIRLRPLEAFIYVVAARAVVEENWPPLGPGVRAILLTGADAVQAQLGGEPREVLDWFQVPLAKAPAPEPAEEAPGGER